MIAQMLFHHNGEILHERAVHFHAAYRPQSGTHGQAFVANCRGSHFFHRVFTFVPSHKKWKRATRRAEKEHECHERNTMKEQQEAKDELLTPHTELEEASSD